MNIYATDRNKLEALRDTPTFATTDEARAYIEDKFAKVLLFVEEEDGVLSFATRFGVYEVR